MNISSPPRNASTLLALFALSACVSLPAASALAAHPRSTGGASAPSGSATTASRTARGVRASALATWYGPGFYGKRTACGQTLTTTLVGVANRSLPCGTLVRLSYGTRRVVVPVIDRGPYGRLGAEWDLTTGAANALGVTETVRISARLVGSTPNTPTLGMPAGSAPEGALAGGTVAAP